MSTYSHFFSKKFQHICVSLDLNFNESLTSDIVSFEQLGPGYSLLRTLCLYVLQDCRVIIWTNDGTSNNWTSKVLNKFKDVVWHLSWSITGNILAVSGGDNKVSI